MRRAKGNAPGVMARGHPRRRGAADWGAFLARRRGCAVGYWEILQVDDQGRVARSRKVQKTPPKRGQSTRLSSYSSLSASPAPRQTRTAKTAAEWGEGAGFGAGLTRRISTRGLPR